MKKLLVTGASGFLGWNLCQIAQQQWEVYGTFHSHPFRSEYFKGLSVDLTDFHALKSLFSRLQPDAVIHLAAQSKPNDCQTYFQESWAINVAASCDIAGLCADANIPCVFTSTDLVFDGLNPPYQESDPVCPINKYGEQKVKAEQGMLARYPHLVICRMPLMFGLPSPSAKSFLQPFLETLKKGQPLSLFTDEFRTPVSANTAAKGLLLALENLQGTILHLGGKERLSRYQFGGLLSQIWDFPTDLIKPCSQKDIPMSAPRPADVSLKSSQAFALGYQPHSVREELMNLKAHLIENNR